MGKPGDDLRKIADEIRNEADLADRAGQWSRLIKLAGQVQYQAELVDGTIDVLREVGRREGDGV